MSSGKRFIDSVKLTNNLPAVASEGSMCWDDEGKAMMLWRNGGWESIAVDPGDVFAVITYDFAKASDILNVPETYTPIVSVTTPARPAGTYLAGLSLTYAFPDINDSVFLRFRQNGGTWNEFVSEPKDVQDRQAVFYQYPSAHAGGVITFEVEMRKEDALSAQLDVTFADVFVQRVG